MSDINISYLSINGCYNFLNLNDKITQSSSKDYFEKKIIYANNSFGLFVTIERNIHKLKQWPEDVHGCLGFYTQEPFKVLTNEFIINKSISLGYDTAYKDSRNAYYPQLYLDYLSNFKISAMLLPLFNINSNTGIIEYSNNNIQLHKQLNLKQTKTNNKTINVTKSKKLTNQNSKTQPTKIQNTKLSMLNKQLKFNNNKYGLITLNNNNTATYLPGVFKNINWYSIKEQLLSKAGITKSNNNTRFLAYKTITYNCSLISFFTNKEVLALKYLEHIITISELFNNNNVPAYEIQTTPSYVAEEYIRNSGICSDIIKAIYFILLHLDTSYVSRYKILINKCLQNCMSYLLSIWKLYEENNYLNKKTYRQAVSFVIIGICYYLEIIKFNTFISINKYNILELKKNIKYYCTDILNNKNDLEENFEYGECGVALFTASIKFNYYNDKALFAFIVTNNFKTSNNIDSIFKINWLIQLITLCKNKFKQLLNALVYSLINILNTYYLTELKNYSFHELNLYTLETNYIAVAYEALMNIYLSNSIFLLKLKHQLEIKKFIVILSVLLISRTNYESNTKSLYRFKSSNARLDITGHTIIV